MTALDPGVTGRKNQSEPIEPLLVSVKQARVLLANMSHSIFWTKASHGEFGPLVGGARKRYLFFANIKKYAENLERAPSREIRKNRKGNNAG